MRQLTPARDRGLTLCVRYTLDALAHSWGTRDTARQHPSRDHLRRDVDRHAQRRARSRIGRTAGGRAGSRVPVPEHPRRRVRQRVHRLDGDLRVPARRRQGPPARRSTRARRARRRHRAASTRSGGSGAAPDVPRDAPGSTRQRSRLARSSAAAGRPCARSRPRSRTSRRRPNPSERRWPRTTQGSW